MEITFQLIESLIVKQEWVGNQVNLSFKASNQEKPMDAMGMAMPDHAEIQKKIAIEMAKVAASSAVINTAGNALGNLTGFGGAGNIISNAAGQMCVGYQMDMTKIMQVDLTEELKQKIIVDAFKNLQAYYHYQNNEWIYAPTGG